MMAMARLFLFCLGVGVRATTDVTFKVSTSTADSAESSGNVGVKFMVDGAWTAVQSLVHGPAKGHVYSIDASLASWPTKLELSFIDSSQDAWGFWKAEFNDCWVVLENPNGEASTPYSGTMSASERNPWWIDGNDEAPRTIELELPEKTLPCGGGGHWKVWQPSTCAAMTELTCSGGLETVCAQAKPAPKISNQACNKKQLADFRWATYYKGIWTWLVIMIIGQLVARRATFDDKTLAPILIFMATICCWLMWTITYFMQINPLLQPVLGVE